MSDWYIWVVVIPVDVISGDQSLLGLVSRYVTFKSHIIAHQTVLSILYSTILLLI